MSDLAPFVAAAIRDEVVTRLQAENDKLVKENAKLKSYKEDISNYAGSLLCIKNAVPIYEDYYYCKGFIFLDGVSEIGLLSFALGTPHGDLSKEIACISIDDLFDAVVYIDNQEIYRVSKAERITCTDIHRDIIPGLDRIRLDISFDGQAHLLVSFEVPRSQTRLWRDLNIVPTESESIMSDLRDSELAGDEEVVLERLLLNGV